MSEAESFACVKTDATKPTREEAQAWLESKPGWYRAAFEEARRRDREKFAKR